MPDTTTITPSETAPGPANVNPAPAIEMVPTKLSLFIQREGECEMLVLQAKCNEAVGGIVNLDRIHRPTPAKIEQLRKYGENLARKYQAPFLDYTMPGRTRGREDSPG